MSLPTDSLRRSRERKRVKRHLHKKDDRVKRDEARVEVKRFLKQQHDYKTTRRQHLPNKPNLKVSGPYRSKLPPCKECESNERAHASSRCKECSLAFKKYKN